MNRYQKLDVQTKAAYFNAKNNLRINYDALREGVVKGESISSLRHSTTNYDELQIIINKEELSEVASKAVHLLQNFINGVIDSIRIEYTELLLSNLNTALEENNVLRIELENLRSNFKLLIENQAILSAKFRSELAIAIKSKEDYIRFVELNFTRKTTTSGKVFPTLFK